MAAARLTRLPSPPFDMVDRATLVVVARFGQPILEP